MTLVFFFAPFRTTVYKGKIKSHGLPRKTTSMLSRISAIKRNALPASGGVTPGGAASPASFAGAQSNERARSAQGSGSHSMRGYGGGNANAAQMELDDIVAGVQARLEDIAAEQDQQPQTMDQDETLAGEGGVGEGQELGRRPERGDAGGQPHEAQLQGAGAADGGEEQPAAAASRKMEVVIDSAVHVRQQQTVVSQGADGASHEQQVQSEERHVRHVTISVTEADSGRDSMAAADDGAEEPAAKRVHVQSSAAVEGR